MKYTFQDLKEVFTHEFWDLKKATSSPRKRFLVKQVRIFSLAFRGFSEDKVKVRASSLTFFTMLSIVPVVAMAFGVAKGFGFEGKLETYIHDALSGQDEVATWILEFTQSYLGNIKGGAIAGVGVGVLLYAVMRLLGNIEQSFNDIWQIKKSRVISRKLSDYISLVVIAPILLVLSSSVTIFLSEQVRISSEAFPLVGYIGPFLGFLVSLIPYILIWLVFTLLYIIMPNTRVNFKSALIGGVIGGTMFQLLQLGYVHFQSFLTSYEAIYGGFAALPLFLLWLQFSWLIVLFGAEVSFANQNIGHYEAESESTNISMHLKRTISLMISKLIADNFKNKIPAMTAGEIADKLDISVRLVRDIMYELLDTGIVVETVTNNVKENGFQPAVDINQLSISDVINLLDQRGTDKLTTDNKSELEKMLKLVDGFSQEIENSKNNKLLVDLN